MIEIDDKIRHALQTDRTVDITTIGRKSGQPRRIEIWFHAVDGRYYLSGSPGKRSWYANLMANPEFTFHLKGTVKVDLRAMAHPIVDKAERRAVMAKILEKLGMDSHLEAWIAGSPLVEVVFLPEDREDLYTLPPR